MSINDQPFMSRTPGIYIYILKRKSFATLTKMLVPFFGPKQSLSDN